MTRLADDPQRLALSAELHARPFPVIAVPARAALLAMRHPGDGTHERAAGRAHLERLLDRFGVQNRPLPGATHFSGPLGRRWLKWESHTEFDTWMLISEGGAEEDAPFSAALLNMFPADWLADLPGQRITSALIRVERMPPDPQQVSPLLESWFQGESLAVSQVLDGDAVAASDFRLDDGDHARIAVFVAPGCGPHRTGRVVQRLAEIETYSKMSLLGLMLARETGPELSRIEAEMTRLTAAMADDDAPAEATLQRLLSLASALEALSTRSSFRYGATGAYAEIVRQRIGVLRETRFLGRQTVGEFMTRRWEPAMRTAAAAERRLLQMTERGGRASNLLRTRVDVERSAQNQRLLESMDRRADLQLRLQETVEGLSVVAISYYAVSLCLYLLAPLAGAGLVAKPWLATLVTPVVVAVVWAMVRRIRRRMH
ncbi:DUF3422 family protein [Mangrovicoccus algicola]|uniref:DUF3422 domain-containing protein n=1 Tax=Mangrovicoccus algicola TaxID=2771008 RepID=A0A8J6YZG9_9RHOB|nr:DUF3422 domain-containing protein [Mangrovicoccus algicola]MBE3638693.1 DUF3422 domain-containing protein [Mangrovicoccus algicola]